MDSQFENDSGLAILKLGGSLLDVEDLRDRLWQVFDRYRPLRILLVVGGGATADLVRNWDRLHQLGNEEAHQLALHAMTFNSRFMSALLGLAGLSANLEECARAWQSNRVVVIDPASFARSLEATSHDHLPHTWEATSDSISAWIATQLGADRLVLLKSTDGPREGLLELGNDRVDAAFAGMCRRVRHVEWINLRAATPEPNVVRVQ